MKNFISLFIAFCILGTCGLRAELFTTDPTPVQQSSQNVKIIFNAKESGKAALINASALYAHIGVCLQGSSKWSHVKCDWNVDTPYNRFVKQADGTWVLTIGDINTYFGLNDDEKIGKIAVIARTPKDVSPAAQTDDYFITVDMGIDLTSAQEDYPGGVPQMGAIKNSNGTVTFCLAAPGKKSVVIVPSWDNYQIKAENVMKYQDYNGYRYFWTTVSGLDNDKYYPYYYLVDNSATVADPCAKLILDPNDKWIPQGTWFNGSMPAYPYDKVDGTLLAVYRGDIDDYKWDSATLNFRNPDTKSMVVYEINLRDFTGDGSDTNGKHYGTFHQAKEKISYLKELGINVVELMPVMEFNGNSSWGYNTNAYMALDKVYGSPTDMRDFVAECHRSGIAVVLDIVFNQTDGLHPWYQMYSASSNPFYNQSAPHSYSVLNDIRQDCPIVQQHWKDVLRYWMEAYKIDGYRFDLVKGLGNNNSYGSGTDAYNGSRVTRMKELNQVITSVRPDGIHINELLGTASEDNANGKNGQLGWNNVNGGAADYAKANSGNFSSVMGFYSPNWGKNFGVTVDYAESHDEPRIAYKIKDSGHTSVKYSTANPSEAAIRRLGSVASFMLMSPGAKMIWQFGELGADEEQGSDLHKLRAIEPKWNQLNDEGRKALHDNYQALCNLRLYHPEMFNGTAEYSYTGFSNNFFTARYQKLSGKDSEIIAVYNANVGGDATVKVPVQYLSANNCELITSAYNSTPEITFDGSDACVTLPAHSFAVYATTDISGVESINCVSEDFSSTEYYDLQGRKVDSNALAPGLYLKRSQGRASKVIVK